MQTRGKGEQNSKNFADVLDGWFPIGLASFQSRPFAGDGMAGLGGKMKEYPATSGLEFGRQDRRGASKHEWVM